MNNFNMDQFMAMQQPQQPQQPQQEVQPQSSPYPAMPNVYGLGSQDKPKKDSEPDSSSRSSNPWDLGIGVSGAR